MTGTFDTPYGPAKFYVDWFEIEVMLDVAEVLLRGGAVISVKMWMRRNDAGDWYRTSSPPARIADKATNREIVLSSTYPELVWVPEGANATMVREVANAIRDAWRAHAKANPDVYQTMLRNRLKHDLRHLERQYADFKTALERKTVQIARLQEAIDSADIENHAIWQLPYEERAM